MIDPEPSVLHQHELWEHFYSKERICRKVDTLPLDEPVHEGKVRFVCISDTHDKLDELMPRIPHGDILLHCGDFTNFGDADELDKFNAEMGQLSHKYKIVIAGNHELGMEDGEDLDGRRANAEMWEMGSGKRGTPQGYKRLTNCVYLHDNSIEVSHLQIESIMFIGLILSKVFGLTVYGTSWHPLPGFSFYRPRGEAILKEWLKIPPAVIGADGRPQPRVDVLMTHTPPLGHSDVYMTGERWGDADLLNCIEKRIKPRVHVFGHVHEQPFATTNGETLFINAAICTHGLVPKNNPVLFDLPLPEGIKKE